MKSKSKNILHPVIKRMIRITASLYFEKVHIKGLENIPEKGPAILACNHPNSFLDALIITVYYRRPIYYIARGDAFKKPLVAKVLGFLNNVPIFRKEEGVSNLSKNEKTFSYCIDVLKEGDTVLLFSEGVCENEWYLRTLRKGTGRLVHDAWNDGAIGDKLIVIPVATNYSAWHGTGSIMNVELLAPIAKDVILDTGEQGLFLRKFNDVLAAKLGEKVIHIDKSKDVETQNTVTEFLIKNFTDGHEMARQALQKLNSADDVEYRKKYTKLAEYIKQENIKYYEPSVNAVLFSIAAFIAFLAIILNTIPYILCKCIAEKTTKRNVFYDSVFFGSLLLLGPVYMSAIGVLPMILSHSWYWILLPVIAMLSAWSYEASKRNIYSFLQRQKHAKIKTLLIALFEKGNG